MENVEQILSPSEEQEYHKFLKDMGLYISPERFKRIYPELSDDVELCEYVPELYGGEIWEN